MEMKVIPTMVKRTLKEDGSIVLDTNELPIWTKNGMVYLKRSIVKYFINGQPHYIMNAYGPNGIYTLDIVEAKNLFEFYEKQFKGKQTK